MIPLTLDEYSERFGDESRPETPFSLHLAEVADTPLPRREARTHKYSYGRALLLAGCRGYTGAGVLAANACERSGAGLTHLLVPESIYPIVCARTDGAVVTPMPSDAAGSFALSAETPLLPLLEAADALCVGPGLGTGEEALSLAASAIAQSRCPLVVDADALRVLDAARKRGPAPVILTPHEGEYARMGGDLSRGRLAGALSFTASRENVILILKGPGTLICRGNEVVVNPTGTPAMAKGGSGDVLSGMLTALLAQGFDPWMAARCAVYLHGLAGEIAAKELGEYCVTPSDLIAALPKAFRAVCQRDN